MHTDKLSRKEEFSRLWAANASLVYGRIRSMVPNHVDAEDLYQDVATTAWIKFEQFVAGSNFGAWAAQIVQYKVLNFHRQRRSRYMQIDDDAMDLLLIDVGEHSKILDKHFRGLPDCFAKLSTDDQQIILERYETGATVKDVAERLGKSTASVYKALERIHRFLFECITREV